MNRLFAFLLFILAAACWALPAQAGDGRFDPVFEEIVQNGDNLLKNYTPEKAVAAGNAFSVLYFDLFEASGLEFRIGASDKEMLLDIESHFSQLIGQSMGGQPKASLAETWTALKSRLQEAKAMLDEQDLNQGFWPSFLQSFFILLREGAEAILVISALVMYLRRVGAGDQVRVIWWSCILALLASAGLAYLAAGAVRLSGLQRELIEGITLLLAAAVLFYVSCWLFAKREAERWQGYITAQVDQAVSSGSVLALGFAAFLAVFREGAETVLFYQALLAGAEDQKNAIALGFAAAAAVLLIVFFLFRFFAVKIPLKPFFTATAVLLFAMSFVFIGKGVLELQVAGWISTTKIAGLPSLSWLGLFPSYESLGAQAVLLVLLALLWVFAHGKRLKTE